MKIQYGLTLLLMMVVFPAQAERLMVKKQGTWSVVQGEISPFLKDPEVEWVEKDVRFTLEPAASTVITEDPLSKDQWSLKQSRVFSALDLFQEKGIQPESVLVAVIDTGVDLNHPDLKENLYVNPNEIPGNGIDDDHNGWVDDVQGYNFAARPGEDDHNEEDPTRAQDDDNHGTHVAGIIGAVQNNQFGISGIGPKVKILPIRWMIRGSGWGSDAIASIHYAVQMGARIINASWGGIGYSKALEEAVREAEAKGVLFVASAGNFKGNNDVTPRHPANLRFSNVITVADTNETDELAKTSNYGKTQVEFAAPGENIISTFLKGAYSKLSGTSMSAAHVSGVGALLLSANPHLRGQDLKRILMETVDPLASLREKTVTGGRVNAHSALLKALQMSQNKAEPFYEFGEVDERTFSGAGFIRPDQVLEEDPITGLSIQLVRKVKGVEIPIEGISFKTQLHAGNGTFRLYQTDFEGKIESSVCQRQSFTVTATFDTPRYRIENEGQPYDLVMNLKCGVRMKLVFEEKTEAGQVVGIWQILRKAEQKLESEVGLDFWKVSVPFVWPSRGDFFDGNAVHLTYGYQWDVVSHEMGHAIYGMARIGAFGGGEHYIDRCYGTEIALSEGWASFYGAWLNFGLTDSDPGFEFMVPRRAPIKIETIPEDVCGKSTNEWRVTGFLWDLIDQHPDPEDLNQDFSVLWRDTRGLRASSLDLLRKRLVERGWDSTRLDTIWKLNFPAE